MDSSWTPFRTDRHWLYYDWYCGHLELDIEAFLVAYGGFFCNIRYGRDGGIYA